MASVAAFFKGAAGYLNRAALPMSRYANMAGISIVILMMLMTVADVVLRYFFNRPILGAYELIEFILVIVVFFAVAYTMAQDRHVSVDVLITRLPDPARYTLTSINTLMGLGIALLITWRTVLFALAQKFRGVTSPALHISVYPFILLLALGAALLFLVLLAQYFDALGRALEKGGIKTGLILIIGSLFALFIVTSPIWLREAYAEMNPFTVGIIGIIFLVLLLFSGMPVGFVMAIVGFMGMTYLNGVVSGVSLFGRVPYGTTANHAMSVLPLFILMGALCFHSGISREIYYTVYRWLGNLPGGLAMATIGACAGFAAVSGSSVASTAAMGTVAMPEMKRYNYAPSLATGCIAAGSSIGILIPPSIMLVVYGILAEQSIGQLFLAGFIPGIMEALFYMVTIYILCKRNPQLGPKGPATNFRDKIVALKDTWAMLVLFILVIGGIYVGLFTPTEAAGIGAFGALVLALARKKLKWSSFSDSLVETGQTASMAFVILIGSVMLGYFLTVTRLPFSLAETVSALEVNRYIVLAIVLVIYIFLGAIMSAIAMIMLTVPIFAPIIQALGFDPIWFGIILVRVCEIGQITPPVGINVYVMKGIAKDVPLYTIFRGTLPFLLADFLHVIILIAFPRISLFLPNLAAGLQ
ncbi:MAG: TRAP transporter large permease subunit [Deltaproteobacteria bacterium]|nr:TRAP transporter large permease subunit [Deltaproteobacteria bacterium]